jgi:ADP-ribosylglycohydrolase
VEAAVQGIDDKRVVDTIRSAHPRERSEVKSGGYVLDTLGAAFWCILGTPSAENAVCQAVELGWDTDTTGAVTGALAGALYGESGLPDRWLEVIHGRAELTSLALSLTEMDGLGDKV